MKQIQEEWRPVVGYEGRYEVSNLGRVRSLPRAMNARHGGKPNGYHMKGRILKPVLDSRGYYIVGLCGKIELVHRIVLTAFVSNPEKKPCCDHIDANRKNNRLDNLRWATYSENNSHPHAIALRSKPVLQIDKETGEVIARYPSTVQAGLAVGSAHVASCCLGKRKTAGGYKWRYENE